MTRADATALAELLLEKHGLLGQWKFVINTRAKRWGGWCDYRNRTISIASWMVDYNDEARVQNTLLHEIAHALVGPFVKAHGPIWKRKALDIGCDGQRCYNGKASPLPPPNRPPLPWVGSCPNGHLSEKARRPLHTHSCGICRPRVFDVRYLITWTRRSQMTQLTPATSHEKVTP